MDGFEFLDNYIKDVPEEKSKLSDLLWGTKELGDVVYIYQKPGII